MTTLVRRIGALSAMLFLAAACGLDSLGPDVRLPGGEPVPGEIRVLFIGNSLTYWNDLPGVVEALADSVDVGPVRVGSVTAPDFSLSDHWDDGAALSAIARGGWTYVVLQQGPSALESSRALLIADAQRFAERIRAVSAQPALYQVWPSIARQFDWDRSLESYRLAADTVQGVLLPAGSAWRAAWARDSGLDFYSPDGLHPTVAGTWIAAAAMLATLTTINVWALPAGVRTAGGTRFVIPDSAAATLRDAAAEVTGQLVPPLRGLR